MKLQVDTDPLLCLGDTSPLDESRVISVWVRVERQTVNIGGEREREMGD